MLGNTRKTDLEDMIYAFKHLEREGWIMMDWPSASFRSTTVPSYATEDGQIKLHFPDPSAARVLGEN